MDAGRFWEIIETARASARQDRPFHEALTDHLATLTEQDILEYYERFEKMHGALYRRDLWAAAYLIRGGCSDDSFIDFRAGLIAQGHDWYHKAAASPDSLAGHPAVAGAGHPLADIPLFYEEVNYAASCAFERVSGDEDAFWDGLKERGPRVFVELMGEDFDFDDDQEMRRRLPRLFRSSHPASRDLSSTAWLTQVGFAVPGTHPPASADHQCRTGNGSRALPLLRRSPRQSPALTLSGAHPARRTAAPSPRVSG